ncbi:hypothetical protein CTAYLR_002960 [Chrysophaeum taylorii]|uniref:Uncharacterized protein n=1 Tax=Chrysophaeum taylorii TaxID=2483200 RepID=A0AAD7U5D8_9STRA|nr:hypothetical protein CTAYLR_002960 [Chrysophaeum taylorii]
MLLSLVVVAAAAAPCPVESDAKSRNGRAVTVKFWSNVDAELELFWVDGDGVERPQGVLMPLAETERSSFEGHVFRIRASHLVKEHIVTSRETVIIDPCGDLVDARVSSSEPVASARASEFESLVRLGVQLGSCVGPSAEWSCVRYLNASDLERRDPTSYGLQPNESRRAYQTVDTSYVAQIPKIPRVSPGEGYLKMRFTEPLKEVAAWYVANRNFSKSHGVIPGGYTNNDKVEIHKLPLDEYPDIHAAVVREMRDILEWWTGLRLRHTSTFGVRVYRRSSTLIHHVDRMDTHLASAVLQLYQDVDEGWPLELYLPHKRVAEVYLQPMELVLYEGAWLRHGRPMRFKGTEFANVFSHFAPPDWPHLASSTSYYGVPDYRLTTLADPPDPVLTSNHFLVVSSKHDEL